MHGIRFACLLFADRTPHICLNCPERALGHSEKSLGRFLIKISLPEESAQAPSPDSPQQHHVVLKEERHAYKVGVNKTVHVLSGFLKNKTGPKLHMGLVCYENEDALSLKQKS